MGWLARFLGAVPRHEREGLHLDLTHPFWELDGKTTFPVLFRALPEILRQESILYFEGGFPNDPTKRFFSEAAVPEFCHIGIGTIWPRPQIVHVPATARNLIRLEQIAESCAEPELAIHFHVYAKRRVLLEWHDAFTQPMLLAGDIEEVNVRAFAERLGMSYHREIPKGTL